MHPARRWTESLICGDGGGDEPAHTNVILMAADRVVRWCASFVLLRSAEGPVNTIEAAGFLLLRKLASRCRLPSLFLGYFAVRFSGVIDPAQFAPWRLT